MVFQGAVQSLMKVGRRKLVIKIPATLKELAEGMDDISYAKNFYRGYGEAADGSICLIFIPDGMLKLIRKAKHGLSDGTFAILPRDQPRFAQLYTIHFKCYESVSKTFLFQFVFIKKTIYVKILIIF